MKLSICLALLSSTAVAAHADLSYTQTTSSPFGSMMPGGGAMKTKTWVKGTTSRIETGGFSGQAIMITRDAGKSITHIDPATKTYTILTNPTNPTGIKFPFGPSEMTVTVKKLGTEKVRGVNAPHWRIDMLTKVKTQNGTRPMKMSTDIWNSNIVNSAQNTSTEKMPAMMKAMFGANLKMNGDLKGMQAAYRTVPLRMTMSMNGNTMSTTETTNISTKPVPASFFSVPAGYKKISAAEWSKRQQAAMRKMMQGITKNRR
jgi:hypothetical protein